MTKNEQDIEELPRIQLENKQLKEKIQLLATNLKWVYRHGIDPQQGKWSKDVLEGVTYLFKDLVKFEENE